MRPRPALFLDRDGVLVEDVGYPHRLEDLHWIAGAQEAVRLANESDWWVFVITNQSGVGRGLFGADAVEAFHAAMTQQLAAAGAHVDRFYSCFFHPEAVVAEWRHPDHPDRKPNPGMVLRAMVEHPVERARAVMIGDRATDLEAARRAGVRGHLYKGGDLLSVVRSLIDSPL